MILFLEKNAENNLQILKILYKDTLYNLSPQLSEYLCRAMEINLS